MLELIYKNENFATVLELAESEDLELVESLDPEVKTQIYIQDLIRKTETRSKKTLLAELNVSIKLYEDDYVDQYASFKFDRIFGAAPLEESMMSGKATELILAQELDVVAHKNI